jgi:TRAP-type C4-dicarboxylate transport system permease small subunit
MNQFWSVISNAYYKLLDVLNFISLLLIFFMAFWMCADVVARFSFNWPIPGTSEVVKSLLPAIVFLSLAYALRHKRHVRVEIVLDFFPPQVKGLFNVIACFMGFITFAAISFYCWDPAWQGLLVREYEGVQLEIPIYPIRFICVLGSGLFSLQFLIDMFSSITKLLNPKRESYS